MKQVNPWGLDTDQELVVDLLTLLGSDKAIAKTLNISPEAVRCRMGRIKTRMGAANRVQAALMWDRFAMGREG